MKRHELPFAIHDELIVIEAVVASGQATATARMVLDTGAVYTTITPEFAELLGYSARNGLRRTRVHTAIGSEEGYVLEVGEFGALGGIAKIFPVHVFDLGHDDIDGLIGLNFLNQFNYEVRSVERRILAESVAAAPT